MAFSSHSLATTSNTDSEHYHDLVPKRLQPQKASRGPTWSAVFREGEAEYFTLVTYHSIDRVVNKKKELTINHISANIEIWITA